MLEAEVVEDLSAPGWDALAVAGRAPTAAPAVVAGWWRHLAPQGAQLRLIAVREGGELVGLAPLWSDGRTLRLACTGVFNRVAPLAATGREAEVAAAMVDAMDGADLLLLEGIPADSPWPRVVPGRAFTRTVISAPVAHLPADFDAWMATRSKNFRGQMRRARRALEEGGGAVRRATAETLRSDLEAFWRMHSARWDEASNLAEHGTGVVDALEDIGRGSAPDRFRLWVVEAEGEPAAVLLFVAAGGLVTYWNGGWDERFARHKPALLAVLAAVEEACGAGDDLSALGAGAQDYKQRFADGDEPLAWGGVILPGPRSLLTRARLSPELAARRLRTAIRR